jgi:hypothetical protein
MCGQGYSVIGLVRSSAITIFPGKTWQTSPPLKHETFFVQKQQHKLPLMQDWFLNHMMATTSPNAGSLPFFGDGPAPRLTGLRLCSATSRQIILIHGCGLCS